MGAPLSDDEKRVAAFQTVCTLKRYDLTAAYSTFAPEIAKKVLRGDIPTFKEIADKYPINPSEVALLFQEFRSLLQDFEKIEEALKEDYPLTTAIKNSGLLFLTGEPMGDGGLQTPCLVGFPQKFKAPQKPGDSKGEARIQMRSATMRKWWPNEVSWPLDANRSCQWITNI